MASGTNNLHHIDTATITSAYENGGFLLVFNIPRGTTIGLNWTEFKTDEGFLGFKMIPSDKSVNFVYANASSEIAGNGAPAARTGSFFSITKPGQIFALQWNAEDECLESYNGENLPDSNALKVMDKNLAPFPYDHQATKWKSLTGSVVLGEVVVSEKNSCEWCPNYATDELPKYWFDKNKSDAMEMYRYSEDSSWVIPAKLGMEKLVSDFEYNFVWFVLGQEFEGFEAWKENLKLLAHYSEAYHPRHKEFKKIERFIRTLIIQMVEFPRDMFEIKEDRNLLFVYLSRIIQLSSKSMPERSARLSKFIGDQFGWQAREDDYVPEDERPVVVEI
jgi:hypothetical protein